MHQRVPETEVSAVMRLVYGGLHSLKEYAGKRVARSILRIMPPLTATPIPDSLATRAAKAKKKMFPRVHATGNYTRRPQSFFSR